jgi:hypothetical protein
MFPRLTPIDSGIVDKIKNTTLFEYAKLNCFVRLISGTGKGLIMISNPDWKIFEATGAAGASFYGTPDRSGTIGVNWEGKAVNVNDETIIDVPFKPSPIVTSINIKEGKDQISRHCDLKITAYTLGQVELIQKYCMEPGHSLNVEFGWNTPNGFSGLINTSNSRAIPYRVGTRNLDFDELQKWRITTQGDYDSFFGFIVGGSVTSNGDAFEVSIKLRGAPGLPTYMQSQFNVKQTNANGKISNDDAEKPFEMTQLNLEAADQMAERRFKYMFNELPKTRQTKQVKELMGDQKNGFSNLDFINLDPVIENQISIYRDGRTINAFGGLSGSAAGVPEPPTGTNSTSTNNTATNTTGQNKQIAEQKGKTRRTDAPGMAWEELNNIAKKYVDVSGDVNSESWKKFLKDYPGVTQQKIDEAIKTRTKTEKIDPVAGQKDFTGGQYSVGAVTGAGVKPQKTLVTPLEKVVLTAFPPEPLLPGGVTAVGASGGFSAAPTGQASATEIMLAGGIALPKEKLFSKNKYIRFAKAVQILNANSSLNSITVANIPVNIIVDIDKCKIGAFKGIYSTKPEALLVPGIMPDFSQFFMEQNMQELTDDEKLIDNSIKVGDIVIQFAQPSALDSDGFKEDAYNWGYLENLYVNFDLFKKEIEKPNRTMREVLESLLNEMSLAVNSFWHFQITEKSKTINISGKDMKTTVFTIYDENWVGKKNVVPPSFIHSGEESRFLQADLSIEIPGAMMNKIIGQRLSLSTNPDQKDIALGGCFSADTDMFFRKYEAVNSAKKSGENSGTGNAGNSGGAGTDQTKVGNDTPTELETKLTAEVTKNKNAVNSEEKTKQAKEIAAKEKANNEKINVTIPDLENQIKAKNDEILKARRDAGFYKNDSEAAAIAAKEAEKKTLQDKVEQLKADYAQTKSNIDKEASDFITGIQQAASANISNNLNKIDVVPNPAENTLTQDDLNNFINDISLFKNKFRIYCCRDAKFLNVLKTNKLTPKLGSGTMSPPLPIKYSFTILGRSGIRRGNTFTIIGIPEKYRTNGFFQVTEVEHTIQDMKWTTRVQGEFRQVQ